jgi:hypothetical protein
MKYLIMDRRSDKSCFIALYKLKGFQFRFKFLNKRNLKCIFSRCVSTNNTSTEHSYYTYIILKIQIDKTDQNERYYILNRETSRT